MTTPRIHLSARVLELTRNLSTIKELESYLHDVLSVAAELTGSESASLLEYDDVAKEFFFNSMLWFQGDAVRSARIPVHGSVAGWVFLHNKPVAIDDVSKDDRHYKKIDELAGFTTKSILGVPVVFREKTVAVLEVFNKPEKYTEDDILLIETLAALVGAALQNDSLEKKILSTQDEARELEELKNEFIAIASHELRTPLGLILGHATFLKELLNEAEFQEQVETIIRNATKLKEIIESLTSVDNYESGSALLKSRKVSVTRIIEDVAISFHEMAKNKDIALKTEIQPGHELLVDIDGGKIAIVLSNLLKNALTFTNKNGKIVIRGEQHVDYVKVTVQDNGIGIPPNDLNRIFDRFYQVESHLTRKHGGMGLGLSVAKVMIEMHGGRIWAESKEGEGSIFSFLLPVRNTQPLPQTPFKT
ncbi:MAG: GAF domain-containing sensor histidine kinase [Anaerolineales bacterium]|nr:GAF domain-containing sensor histidine kinase [Anaerolineales bacterium]